MSEQQLPPRAGDAEWPAHGEEILPWRQAIRGGSHEDRSLTQITTRVPPTISHRHYAVPTSLSIANERALLSLSRMDAESVQQPKALGRFMIRTESVASSKIERVSASLDDFARAMAGNRSNESAMSMVAATEALSALVATAGRTGVIQRTDIEAAHLALMRNDPEEGPYAGRVRQSQNWIGGSDHSPRNAFYVPPSAQRADELLDDLLVFANRDDVPVLAQVTIAHAQFESIRPFGDGNGRIGRALMGAILRRRGVTMNTVAPIASGLLARRDDYFDALTDYREGRVDPLLHLVLRSAEVAGDQGRTSVRRIGSLPAEWMERSGARARSTAAKLLPAFFDNPVMTATDIEDVAGTALSQAYAAINRLEAEGIVHEVTGRKRDRVWVATDLMAELDSLDMRIAQQMRAR